MNPEDVLETLVSGCFVFVSPSFLLSSGGMPAFLGQTGRSQTYFVQSGKTGRLLALFFAPAYLIEQERLRRAKCRCCEISASSCLAPPAMRPGHLHLHAPNVKAIPNSAAQMPARLRTTAGQGERKGTRGPATPSFALPARALRRIASYGAHDERDWRLGPDQQAHGWQGLADILVAILKLDYQMVLAQHKGSKEHL